ncbi:MBL fold metallo-hydrolase, partial [Streptomyces sp. NPDC056659]
MLNTGYTETGYGGGVTVMVGAERGAYPYANSVLVRGAAETLVIDPSLSLVGAAPPADVVRLGPADEGPHGGRGEEQHPGKL